MLTELYSAVRENMFARVVRLDGEPNHVYGIAKPDGTIERMEAKPKPRNYSFHNVDALINALTTLPQDDCVIFVGENSVIAVIGESDGGRERFSVSLVKSREYATLLSLASNRKMFDQKQFIQLLSIDLHAVGGAAHASKFRTLKFTQSNEADKGVEATQSKVKRSTLAAITGIDELPDMILLSVPVYRDMIGDGWKIQIRCAVIVDPIDEKFSLVPLGGELEFALNETLVTISSDLELGLPKGSRILIGTP